MINSSLRDKAFHACGYFLYCFNAPSADVDVIHSAPTSNSRSFLNRFTNIKSGTEHICFGDKDEMARVGGYLSGDRSKSFATILIIIALEAFRKLRISFPCNVDFNFLVP